jgi:hypothetical protein
MGYGVAKSKRSSRYKNAENSEVLSLGLAHGHSLQMMARVCRPYCACTAATGGRAILESVARDSFQGRNVDGR